MTSVQEVPADRVERSGLADLLSEHLSEHLGRAVTAGALRRLAGGVSHETWSFRLTDNDAGRQRTQDLVLRRDIEGALLQDDVAHEFGLLTRLHRLGIPVARPWSSRPAAEGTGPGFMIVEQVPGADLRKAIAAGTVADRTGLAADLVRVQGLIHAVDWQRELADVISTDPGDVVSAQLDRWAAPIEEGLDADPTFVGALGWLRAHNPGCPAPVLVHGDFKANNILVGDGRARAVLDWELAHVGDRLEDLAWTLLWTTGSDLIGGLLGPEQYLQAYESAANVRVDRDALRYWHIFCLVKLAAILRIQAGLHTELSPSPTLAMMGRAIPHLEHQLAECLLDALGGGQA